MNPRIAIAVAADYNGRWANQVVNDAGRVATGVQKAGQQAAQSMQAANLNTANLAAQLNDIGVMLASGQSPLLLALQQGTQVSQALGPVGVAGAAKSLGAAFLSVFSPLNLITIGTIAVGAAAVQWLVGLNSEAPKAEDRLKAHEEWLGKILNGYSDVQDAAQGYYDELSKLPEGVVSAEVSRSLSEQRDLIASQADMVGQLNARVRDYVGLLSLPSDDLLGQLSISEEDLDRLRNYVTETDRLNISSSTSLDTLGALMGTTKELMNTIDDPAVDGFLEDIYSWADGLRLARAESARLASIIASLSFPALPAGYQQALSQLDDLATPAMTDRDKARAALNEGLAGAQDAITRRAIEQKYNAAIAQIEAEEAARKSTRTTGGGTAAPGPTGGGRAIDTMLDVIKETRSEAQKLADTISSSLATSVTGFFSTIRSGGDAMGYLANQLGNVADQLLNNALQSLFGSLFGGFSFGGGIGGIGGGLGSTAGGAVSRLPFGPPRAAGGPVSAGVVYPVGERGPELFVPQRDGTIIPNHKLGGSAASSGGATTVRIELGEGLVGKVLDRAGRQTVQIVQSITPGMIKSEAPAAVAAARRDGRL